MPGLDTTAPNAGGDELDDLFNYDIDVDAAFRGIEERAQASSNKDAQGATSKSKTDLGIDEEVQIKATRKPIPKLDQQRLLSERGIPKLRKLTKDKLKFKGKGHEFSDIARMLSLYQLWLDELYPRAKFLDSLAMVEKLGHSKSLQIMRKDWINESKPHEIYPADDAQDGPSHGEIPLQPSRPTQDIVASTGNQQQRPDNRVDDDPENLFLSNADAPAAADSGAIAHIPAGSNDVPDEDELDALLDDLPAPLPSRKHAPRDPPITKDSMRTSPVREDDLDALWAEHEGGEPPASLAASARHVESMDEAADFADEMEAMADLEG